MTQETLEIIDADLSSLGINYALDEWKGKPKYPYYVGEYLETPSMNEDGMQETTFILTGFNRGGKLALDEAKEKIEGLYGNGKTAITDKGTGVAISYEFCSGNIRTGDAELKKHQINLTVKEWKVN